MQNVDLKTFRPNNVEELLEGITASAANSAANAWRDLRDAIATDLQNLASSTFQTQQRLNSGSIDQGEADFLVHMQELYFHQILRKVKFLSYVAIQAVLDAVFAVIAAAIKNLTGIPVNFGSR